MVDPGGGTQDSTTLTQVVNAVNGPVAQFWSNESQGAISVGVTASHDWMTTAATCADPTALWDEVATAVGFQAGAGQAPHAVRHLHSRRVVGVLLRTRPGGHRARVGRPALRPGHHHLRHRPRTRSQLPPRSQLGASVQRGRRGGYLPDRRLPRLLRRHGHLLGAGRLAQRCPGRPARASCRRRSSRRSSRRARVARYTLSPFSGRTGTRALRLVDCRRRGVLAGVPHRRSAQDAWLAPRAPTGSPSQPGVLLRRASADAGHLAAARRDTVVVSGVERRPADGPPGHHGRSDRGRARSPSPSRTSPPPARHCSSAPSAAARLLANHRPVGGLDPVAATGAELAVTGWAVDPDDPAVPIAVHAYIDGRGLPLLANATRPDRSGGGGRG